MNIDILVHNLRVITSDTLGEDRSKYLYLFGQNVYLENKLNPFGINRLQRTILNRLFYEMERTRERKGRVSMEEIVEIAGLQDSDNAYEELFPIIDDLRMKMLGLELTYHRLFTRKYRGEIVTKIKPAGGAMITSMFAISPEYIELTINGKIEQYIKDSTDDFYHGFSLNEQIYKSPLALKEEADKN